MAQAAHQGLSPLARVGSGRFHVPFEHGAWWAFGSTWLGALSIALFRKADPWACAGAALALAVGFVLQDWIQALIGAALKRKSQSLSRWQAPQGWVLMVLACSGLGLQWIRSVSADRMAWLCLWGGLGLALGLGLTMRVLQSGRGRQSLAFTALLLAGPALPLGVLAFGFNLKVSALLLWPLLYYPAATLATQSFIRGFPERAPWAGPALGAFLGVLALFWKAWLPGGLLLLNAYRWWAVIRTRWKERPHGMPEGGAIRAFGRVQASFGVALTLVWAWIFAGL